MTCSEGAMARHGIRVSKNTESLSRSSLGNSDVGLPCNKENAARRLPGPPHVETANSTTVNDGRKGVGQEVGGEVAVEPGVRENGVDRILPAARRDGPAPPRAEESPAKLARRIARTVAKLERLLALKAAVARRPKKPRRSRTFTWKKPVADWSKESAIVVLALAVLAPALHFFSTKTRTEMGCLVSAAAGYTATCIGPGHRVAVMFSRGLVVPADKLVCHRCDNKPCVEPSHVYVGTSTNNNRDTIERGRRKRVPTYPKFTTWREWVDGGWGAEDVPFVSDTEGLCGEIDAVDLPLAALKAADEMPLNVGMREAFRSENPDDLSEEDERALIATGWRDGEEPDQPFAIRYTYDASGDARVRVTVPIVRWHPT
jgi:hypothetical protein